MNSFRYFLLCEEGDLRLMCFAIPVFKASSSLVDTIYVRVYIVDRPLLGRVTCY